MALFAVTFLTVLLLAASPAGADDDCAHITATVEDGFLTVTRTDDGIVPVTVNGVLVEPRYFRDAVFEMPSEGFEVLIVVSGACVITLPTSAELDDTVPEYAPPPITEDTDQRAEPLPARTSSPEPSRVLPTR